MVNAEFVGEPLEEGGAILADLGFGNRLVRCRFTEDALRSYPPTGDDDALLDRFRALASRKSATVQWGTAGGSHDFGGRHRSVTGMPGGHVPRWEGAIMTRQEEAENQQDARGRSQAKPEWGIVPGTQGTGKGDIDDQFKPGGGNSEGGATNTGPNAGRGGMGGNQ